MNHTDQQLIIETATALGMPETEQDDYMRSSRDHNGLHWIEVDRLA
ncbi:hypothetical protein [Shewanella chilikensis]